MESHLIKYLATYSTDAKHSKCDANLNYAAKGD